MYKRLVGERVLDVKVVDNKDVRLYAHCAAAGGYQTSVASRFLSVFTVCVVFLVSVTCS